MSGFSRRQFLKKSGLATGGAALGGVVSLGLDPAPLRAATLPLAWKIQGTRTVPSVCPYCAVGCGQLVHVRDGKIQQDEFIQQHRDERAGIAAPVAPTMR